MTLLILFLIVITFYFWTILDRKKEARLIKEKKDKIFEELKLKCNELGDKAISLKLSSFYLPHGGSEEFELTIFGDYFELHWETEGNRQEGLNASSGRKTIKDEKVLKYFQTIQSLNFLERESEEELVFDGWRSELFFSKGNKCKKLEYVCPKVNREALTELVDILRELIEIS